MMADRETAADIEEVAADWAVRTDDRSLSADEQSSLDTWLAGDLRRRGAYARALAGFAHVARARALGPDFEPDAYRRQHRGDIRPMADEPVDRHVPLQLVRRRGVLIGAAGVSAAAAIAALGLGWQAAARTVSTRRGEIRLVPLPNGSTMTLNTDTSVRIASDDGREIELLRGEAMFDIANKRGDLFTVRAGGADVCAIAGTFAIANLDHEPVRLIVEQGTAELRSNGPGSPRCRVQANSSAIVRRGAPVAVSPLQPGAVLRSLAWRDGKLAFEDTSLRTAAAEFARYSDTRIMFADPAIGDATVTGLFSANNPVGFANAVASSLALTTQETGDSIELSPREKNI